MVLVANLLHPTLRTESSSFSFCTKSGKYYDRIDYMYTLHMLNIVNLFFSPPPVLHLILLPETEHLYFIILLWNTIRLQVQHCPRTKQAPFKHRRRDPLRLVYRKRMWDFISVSQQFFFFSVTLSKSTNAVLFLYVCITAWHRVTWWCAALLIFCRFLLFPHLKTKQKLWH